MATTEPEPVEVDVQIISSYVFYSDEMLEEAKTFPSFAEMIESARQREAEFQALPKEEQDRILAEREKAYEAKRCPACGCHPNEHGEG
jgi:hypothetical protein